MVRIKKGDEVIVIAGRDRGKQGTVLALEKNSKCQLKNVLEIVGMRFGVELHKNTCACENN